MFSASSLRDKVSHAKNASLNKFQETKDRFSSTPSSNLTTDGRTYHKSPPPRPPTVPSRGSSSVTQSTSSSLNASSPSQLQPPPVLRNTKPSAGNPGPSRATPPPPPSRSVTRAKPEDRSIPQDTEHIDWANLSQEDKEVFFSWLDEFFGKFQKSNHYSSSLDAYDSSTQHGDNHFTHQMQKETSMPSHATAPIASIAAESSSRAPPPIRTWSRPKETSTPKGVIRSDTAPNANNEFTMSHPPSTQYGSAALDLAHYFYEAETDWDTAWYTADGAKPPPLEGRNDVRWTASYSWSGTSKTVLGGVLYADLSICWFTVQFSTTDSSPRNARRWAEYLPCPAALTKEELVQAHETYGDTIASFAESFVGTGQFCARGECWDLANEAIKYFDEFEYVPKPIPSISRTHGHLIFEGKAIGKGKQVGRWRGGDDRVRRGDIVEWRKVRINVIGAPRGSYALLGDPDHTAVIVADSVPARTPRDGENMLPSELVQLEVVEQGVRSLPDRKTYDMAALQEGEVWIYRPIGMEAYLGTTFGPTPPNGVNTMRF